MPATASATPAPARRRWPGRILVLVLLAALVGGAWYLVQRAATPPGGSAPGGFPSARGGSGAGVTVGAAAAVAGELPVILDALGTVTAPVMAALVPQVSGVLAEVLFSEGQAVEKGQVLARLDARPYEQALAQARAQRARDEAQLAAARVTLRRYQTLWKQDSIARQDLDTQEALVAQLQAAVAADDASERTARLNLEFTVIRAPIAGLIGLRSVDPGNLVGTSTTGGIATIAQVVPIDVVFSVPQDRVPAVLAAQRLGALPVTLLDRARTRELASGEFLTLDNQVDVATGTVRAKARFGNTDRSLFPNQFVNVQLRLGAESGVLVPVTAVRTGPQGDYVYVIDDERIARMRSVTRGMATAESVLIVQGLRPGERVVSEGGDRVRDGGPVQFAGGQRGEGRPQGEPGKPEARSGTRSGTRPEAGPEGRAGTRPGARPGAPAR